MMTPRERIIASIEHREPDQVPVDLGSTPSSGISAVAYSWLKTYLGENRGQPLLQVLKHGLQLAQGIPDLLGYLSHPAGVVNDARPSHLLQLHQGLFDPQGRFGWGFDGPTLFLGHGLFPHVEDALEAVEPFLPLLDGVEHRLATDAFPLGDFRQGKILVVVEVDEAPLTLREEWPVDPK